MDRNDIKQDITLTDTIQFENRFTPTKETHLDYLKEKPSNNKATKFAMPLLLFYYIFSIYCCSLHSKLKIFLLDIR